MHHNEDCDLNTMIHEYSLNTGASNLRQAENLSEASWSPAPPHVSVDWEYARGPPPPPMRTSNKEEDPCISSSTDEDPWMSKVAFRANLNNVHLFMNALFGWCS